MHRFLANFIKTTILTSLFLLASFASATTLTWNDAIQLIDANGHATIPEIYTSIGDSAFSNTAVTSIDFPQTITSIGENAFRNTILETISLPNSVNTIGNGAFRSSKLKQIDIPEGITAIPELAFMDSELVTITLPLSLTKINAGAFKQSKLESIVIPNQVTVIGQEAFVSTPLKSVVIGNSVTSIHNEAFKYTKLEYVNIPDSVAYLGEQAFLGAPIKDLIIGNGLNPVLEKVQPGAFANICRTLESLTTNSDIYTDNYRNRRYITIDGSSRQLPAGLYFYDTTNECPKLQLIKLGPDVTMIDNTWINGSNNYNTVLQIESYANIVNGLGIIDQVAMNQPYELNFDAFRNDTLFKLCTDTDSDGDGVLDCADDLPSNPLSWSDSDKNGVPDNFSESATEVISNDTDSDGILDVFDPNPNDSNYDNQYSSNGTDYGEYNLNTDGDDRNNYQDPDDDNDGLLDVYEPFFGTNPLIPDSDFDGVLDGLDAFPTDNTESLDTDTDGIGNNTDTDDDNDGYTDFLDAFPLDATDWADSDSDGIGNNADLDDDNDGVADAEDAFPYTASESVDTDGDGVGDNADAFPSDSTEWADSDLDGIGNNADPDDDNDGVADADDSDPLNDSIGDLPSQIVNVAGTPKAVNGHQLSVSLEYDASDANNQLTGLGYRVHFDSNYLTYTGAQNVLESSVIVSGEGPYQDSANYDGDASTDSYVVFGWAALMSDWPNVELPLNTGDVLFDVSFEASSADPVNTVVNFSEVDASLGYDFEATNFDLSVLPASWDFDGNGSADALSDGLMLLRYTFGIQDIRMTTNTVAEDATLTPEQVVSAMHDAMIIADIDNSSDVSALTDGLTLLRYLFGLRGEVLIDSVIDPTAARTDATDIETYIEAYMPGN